MSLYHYTMPFALKSRKSTEIISQGVRVVLHNTCCIDFTAFSGAASTSQLGISPPQLTVGDFRHALVDTSAFQVAE
jgi:hypothetical protein